MDDNNVSLSEKIEQRLRNQQLDKTFKDSEIRIGGSKKEMAALRTIERFNADLLRLNEEQYGEIAMIKLIKKDKVFPAFDPRQQLDNGISSGAAFLKKKLRDSFPTEPSYNTPLSRRVYTSFANLFYDSLLPIPKVGLTSEKIKNIYHSVAYWVCKFVFDENWESAALHIANEFAPYKELLKDGFTDFDEAYDHIKQIGFEANTFWREKAETVKKELLQMHVSDADIREITSNTHNKYSFNNSEMLFEWLLEIKQRTFQKWPNMGDELIQEIILKIAEFTRAKKNADYLYYQTENLFFSLAITELKIPYNASGDVYEYKNINKWTFLKHFFSVRFANFIGYHDNSYYGKSHYEAYQEAISYDSISEAESQQAITEYTNQQTPAIQQWKNQYSALSDVVFIDEADKLLLPEDQGGVNLRNYGFWGSWTINRKYSTRHARLNELTVTEEKWNWRRMWLQNAEKEIKKLEDDIAQFAASHAPHPDIWSWAPELQEANGQTEDNNAEEKIHKRVLHDAPILSYIERVGGLKIDKSRLTDVEKIKEYLKDTFGFHAFEYGATMKDNEAIEIIYHFLGSVADLGDILNIDLAGLNRQAKLSMAFGSRGRGRAKAHYEMLGRIINLTKSNGDGSVAHEFWHYFDNIIPQLDHPNNYGYLQFASNVSLGSAVSNGMSIFEYKKIRRSEKRKKQKYDSAELENARILDIMLQIMAFITYGKKKIVENGKSYYYSKSMGSTMEYEADVSRVEDTKWNWSESFRRNVKIPDSIEELNALPQLLSARWSNKFNEFESLSRADLLIYDRLLLQSGLGIKKFKFQINSNKSIYYTDSGKVGGPYWIEPTELCARAFAVYVFDKLRASGRFNNFLTSGEYVHATEAKEYIPNYPYPQFEERKYLYTLFDKLINELKAAYGIGDFQPFTTEINLLTKENLDISEMPESKNIKDFMSKLVKLSKLLK